MKRPPIAPTRPRTARAMAAAHTILEIIFDDPSISADELHCRVWRFLVAEFDDVEREALDG
jgi:hypothetical protein